MTRSATLLVLALAAAASAHAQDLLATAKAQYAEASYEEALATLARVEADRSNRVEVEQYRAFCAIALGKGAEAEQAVAAIVAADPLYMPPATDVSPRVIGLFSEIRQKLLPGLARRLFTDGRTAYQGDAGDRGLRTFELLARVLDDPAMKIQPEHEDLRVLTGGFLDLLRAGATTARVDVADQNGNGNGNGHANDGTNGDAVEPAPVATNGSADSTEGSAGAIAVATARARITPPIAIMQTIPPWAPPDAISGARNYNGAVRVVIDAKGRVTSATIERTTHPLYDQQLLAAARLWTYRPATRNGEAIESEKMIEYQLRRR